MVEQKHDLVGYLILPWICPVGQNVGCVFRLVGQLLILVGHCPMFERYFKAWSYDPTAGSERCKTQSVNQKNKNRNTQFVWKLFVFALPHIEKTHNQVNKNLLEAQRQVHLVLQNLKPKWWVGTTSFIVKKGKQKKIINVLTTSFE